MSTKTGIQLQFIFYYLREITNSWVSLKKLIHTFYYILIAFK